MSLWATAPKAIEAITLFVEDLDASKAFYARTFDLPANFEDADSAVFKFGDTLINLLKVNEADELVTPMPVASVAPREAGAHFMFTLGVEDVDAVGKELTARGVSLLNGPINRPWGVRTISFADPDGYVWEIAGPLPRQ